MKGWVLPAGGAARLAMPCLCQCMSGSCAQQGVRSGVHSLPPPPARLQIAALKREQQKLLGSNQRLSDALAAKASELHDLARWESGGGYRGPLLGWQGGGGSPATGSCPLAF